MSNLTDIRAAISNAYYDARNNADTMETAADNAAAAVDAIIEARLAPALAVANWCAVKEADFAAMLRGNYDAYAEGSRDAYDLVETRLRAALGVSVPTGDDAR
jgi:superfamily I DNA/RNA helicase